jgi:hypothetical protein
MLNFFICDLCKKSLGLFDKKHHDYDSLNNHINFCDTCFKKLENKKIQKENKQTNIKEIRKLRFRIKKINSELNSNTVFLLISLFIILVFPWVSFENYTFQINLEVIIAFIVLFVTIFRGFILRSKKEDLEFDLKNI